MPIGKKTGHDYFDRLAFGMVGVAGVDFACLMVIITTMNSRQVIKQLEAEGWFLARVKGSHHQFKHLSKPGLVTVKHPDSDIPAGTLHSIRKQAGWK